MQMLELLRSHLETGFKDFQNAGNSFVPIKPYLKQDNGENSLSEDAVTVILQLPKMLEELCDFIRQDSTPPQIRAVAGGIYSYVFNPFDYIDDEAVGYLGFVDDVLVVFYGMRLLEKINVGAKFLTCDHPVVSSAVTQWERVLSPELLTMLKSYSEQLSDAMGAA